MDTQIILAIIGFAGNITLAFLQFRLWRSQAKKTDVEASGVLVDKALNVNKDFTDYYKDIVLSLKEENKELRAENKEIKV